MTEDLVRYFNEQAGMNLTPIFDQYLRQAALPVLELRFQESEGSVSYRWKEGVKEFAMPVRVGQPSQWQLVNPTSEWKTMKTELKRDQFEVATDRYYIEVIKN
jgi:aminopeptidase N